MADPKEQQPAYPIAAAANSFIRSDTEAATAAAAPTAAQRRNNKRTKCILYIVLFVIFQTGIITLFVLTILKVRTPRLRLRHATLNNLAAGTPTNPSLNLTVTAALAVRNANFGRYRYRDTSVVFFYRGVQMGEALVRNSRVNWRSTRMVDVAVDLSVANAPAAVSGQLGGDLRSGVVAITSQARMRGRVEVLFVMKRNRSTAMNCSMEILTATRQLRNVMCR